MGIYKRNRNWYVRIWIGKRKIERAAGPDKNIAEAMQKKLEHDRLIARLSNQAWTGIDKSHACGKAKLFAEAAQEYIISRKSICKPSTIQTYQDNLKAHLLKTFGRMPVHQITKHEIVNFQKGLAASRSARRTNSILNLLIAILKECSDEGLISERVLNIQRLREEATTIDPITLDELTRILKYLDPFYRPAILTLAWTGMRPCELKALRWTDINLKRPEIFISRGRVYGKETTTKTVHGKRVIPIHPELVEELDRIQRNSTGPQETYVFTARGGQPLSQHLNYAWTQALKKSNVRYRPLYQLRHTWASLALDVGESPTWVARMMGHSNVGITFKHYVRFIPSERNGKLIARIPYTRTNTHGFVNSC